MAKPLVLTPAIAGLKPYVPGKPISETRRETGLKRIIKLASNENPLGPSPRAVAAIRKGLRELHLYPDSSGYELKHALAKRYSWQVEQIVLGNGSDDLIECLVRSFCTPAAQTGQGGSVAYPALSFIAYSVCAQAHGVAQVSTPVHTETFVPDLDALLAAVKGDPKIQLVFLANPNNPTGAFVGAAALRRLAQGISGLKDRRVLLILDDAYGEYVGTAIPAPDALAADKLLGEFPEHVVLLRTFSKIYGLGGLRVGYAVCPLDVAQILNRVRQPFNVSQLGLLGARAALEDTTFVKRSLAVNRQGMRTLLKACTQLGIPTLASQGNFILVQTQVGFGLSGPDFAQALLKRGVIVRPIANYGESRFVRVSIGTAAENQILIRVMRDLLRKQTLRRNKRMVQK